MKWVIPACFLLLLVGVALAYPVVNDSTGYNLTLTASSITAGQQDGEQVLALKNVTNVTLFSEWPVYGGQNAYILDANQTTIAGPISFDANSEVPPCSLAEQRSMRVLEQFSTTVSATPLP